MLVFKRYHQFQHLLPSAIQGLWALESQGHQEQIAIIPDGHPEIIIPIRGQVNLFIGEKKFSCTRPSVLGQVSDPISFALSKNAFIFHLKLYPYFLGQVVDQTAAELANHCEPIATFSKKVAGIFQDFSHKILAGHSPEPTILSMLSQLNEEYEQSKNPLLLADQKYKYELIKSLGQEEPLLKTKYSNRYLEILYKKEIGLSPRKFYKILRIKKASLLMSQNPHLALGAIAATLGYYDPSHFYKDFKSVSQQCPKSFLQNQKALHQNQEYLGQWDFS